MIERRIYSSPSTEIDIFSVNSTQYVRKTVKSCFAAVICNHEVRALARLKAVKRVQQLVEQDSPTSFVSEYIQGESIRHATHIPADYFDNLRGVLADVHAAGVADLDFGHSPDMLIDGAGFPALIDFAASVIHDSDSALAPIIKPLFAFACGLNEEYLLRRQARFAPETMARTVPAYGILATMYGKFKR